MPTVHFTRLDGTDIALTGHDGMSVMEVAVQNGVAGIVAECGGACACATCHVYVAPVDLERVGEAGDWEDEMLEDAVAPRLPNSRLSCQLVLSGTLDELHVRIPEAQQ